MRKKGHFPPSFRYNGKIAGGVKEKEKEECMANTLN